ncbi:hypothetical protein MMC25_007655 [Agyrium rufum]|nr:hypothetical protein [Agyrium rufum]
MDRNLIKGDLHRPSREIDDAIKRTLKIDIRNLSNVETNQLMNFSKSDVIMRRIQKHEGLLRAMLPLMNATSKRMSRAVFDLTDLGLRYIQRFKEPPVWQPQDSAQRSQAFADLCGYYLSLNETGVTDFQVEDFHFQRWRIDVTMYIHRAQQLLNAEAMARMPSQATEVTKEDRPLMGPRSPRVLRTAASNPELSRAPPLPPRSARTLLPPYDGLLSTGSVLPPAVSEACVDEPAVGTPVEYQSISYQPVIHDHAYTDHPGMGPSSTSYSDMQSTSDGGETVDATVEEDLTVDQLPFC